MQQPTRQRLLRIAEWLLLLGLVTTAGLLSKLYTRGTGGVSTIWLANGLTLGFLLYVRRERWVALLVANTAGQVLSGIFAGDPGIAVLVAAVLNTVEVLAAAVLLRTGIHGARELALPGNFLRFFLYAVLLAPLLSTLLLAAYLLTGGRPSPQILEGWFVGHALGMATVGPVILALCGNELARLFRKAHLLELCGGTLLIIVTTTAVFWQTRYPLLFLIFPAVMLAALRAGFAGTAFALIVVVAIAATLTGLGHGPLMLVGLPGSRFGTYLILQTFIGVLLLTCFPVAVTMSALRHRQKIERKLRNRLRLLADHSTDTIVLTDLDGRRLYVSPSVNELLGHEPEEFLRGSFRDLVGSGHVEALQQQLEHLSKRAGAKVTITFPGRHKDGSRLWLEARVKHIRDADFILLENELDQQVVLNRGPSGEEGFIVTLRDITRRHQAEQALESANRKLSSMAWQDGLTGLGNRRRFDQVLADSWEKCRLAELPLSVIMADVDHFKRYNDHYGHQEGDHSLAAVATAINAGLRRERDCAARYGGEEFGLILPGVEAAAAGEIAERIRLGVQQLALPHVGSALAVISVSLGVASCVPCADERPEDLVNAADRALYASKNEGRNRVTVRDGLGITQK